MFTLKNFKLVFTFLLFGLLVASCTKENIEETTIKPGENDPTETTSRNNLLTRSNPNSSTDGLDFDCFYVLYPFDMVDDQQGTHTVTNDDDFEALLSDSTIWIVDFVYPLDLEYEDGSTATANDAEDLGLAFSNCLPNDWDDDLFPAYHIGDYNSCYDLAYPITLQDENGDLTTAADETEFIDLISQEVYFFTFPMDLIDENGVTVTVGDVDELLNTLILCNDFPFDTIDFDAEYIGCYKLEFPFDVTLSDGSTVTVENHMQYCDLLLMGEIVDFVYPITITDEGGNTIVVNSEDELQELLEDCDFGVTEVFGDAILLYFGSVDSVGLGNRCYDINYSIDVDEVNPITGEVLNSYTVNSQSELESLPNFFTGTPYYIKYPASVTLVSDGTVVTLEDIQDLLELINDCN